MILEDIIEAIKLLTVKIETEKEKGTGVLVIQKNRAYVLTVYHCIYGKEESPHIVNNKNISFKFNSKISEEVINPLEIEKYKEVYLKKNIVLLEVDITKLKIDGIPKLLLLDRIFYDKSYHFRGYPKALSTDHPFKAECIDKKLDEITFKIEVDGLTNDTSGENANEFIAGVSGSGLFFSENNQLYLVGLVNALANETGVFNAVHCVKLIDLYNSDIIFTEFYTINKIVTKLKEIDKKISEGACKKFENDNTYEYNNINRKHSNIYHKKEVFSKNFQGIKNYLQGQNSVNNIKLLDNDFENYLIEFISDTLSIIEPSISKYIDTKKEGRDSLQLIRKETIDAIKSELNLIQKNIYISNKLREYIVIGWLLNCNVDFILEEDN